MKNIIIFTILLTLSQILHAQSKDSVLTYERTLDRPLTLHKGQLQINAGYGMSIINANFDEKGNKTNLAELGTASLEHSYNFGFNIGFFDFVELNTALSYKKKGVRGENEMIFTLYNPMIDISYLDKYKGLSDFYIGAGFRYPFKNKTFDIAIYPGISIPVTSNEPEEPEHEYIPVSETQDFIKIYYKNIYPYSTGAKQLHLSASAKYRSKNFGVTAAYESSYPLNISETVEWNYYLLNNEFVYDSEPYEYLISNKTFFSFKGEYQAISWFNINLMFSGLMYTNGWSEKNTLRIPNPETSVYNITAGCEIKITEKLWFTQFIGYPVSGKNQTAPVQFLTNLSYNLIAF